MGEAKRRQAHDPDYGQPQVYLLQLFSQDDRTLLEIPLPIKRHAKPLLTDQNAIGMAGSIVYFLMNTGDYFWHSVQGAIAQYCASGNLNAVPDLETLQAWRQPGALPVEFWAQILKPNGEIVQSRDGDRACNVVMASREGVGPTHPDTEMTKWQGDKFQQFLEAG